MMTGPPDTPGRWRPLVVLVAGALVYLPRLGAAGFSATEGHRVIPAWEMMQTREWFLPTMFGQVYLRKPPGMGWAIAGSSAIFGQSEFGARMVSALSMIALALLVAHFAGRWFGRRLGWLAGLACLLTPLFWGPGRSAEIEALNNLAAAGAVLLLLDGLLFRQRMTPAMGMLAGIAIAAAGLVKGPAAMPAIGGAIAASCIVGRSWRPLISPGLWTALAIAGAVLVFTFLRIRDAVEASGQLPVLQGVSDFVWTGRPLTPASIGAAAIMPLLALLSVMPWALAMLFPWGPDAAGESNPQGLRVARGVVLTSVISLVALAAVGVRNPRYGQPCVAFVPVLVGYAMWGWSGGFIAVRRRIVRMMMLGNPRVLAGALALGAAVYVLWLEPRARASSGRDAGLAMAAHLERGGQVFADHLVEARPETLLYASRASGATVRWSPGLKITPPPGSCLAIRTDEDSGEAAPYAHLEPVHTGVVHKFRFALYRIP